MNHCSYVYITMISEKVNSFPTNFSRYSAYSLLFTPFTATYAQYYGLLISWQKPPYGNLYAPIAVYRTWDTVTENKKATDFLLG